MKGYFVNFIKTGDPNGAGLPVWEKSDGSFKVLEFGDEIRYVAAPYLGLYEVLDEMDGYELRVKS